MSPNLGGSRYMKRILKITFLRIIPITILSLFIILLMAAKFFGKEITNIVVSELNQYVVGKISIKEVTFSLIKKFPDASIIFHEVNAKAPDSYRSDLEFERKVLHAETIYLQLNLLDLIKGVYNINEVHIENADININYNQWGNANFEIFKFDESSSDSSDVNLNIEEVFVKNTSFKYSDIKENTFCSGNIDRLTLTGNYSKEHTKVKTSALLMLNTLKINGDNYVSEKKIDIDTDVDIRGNDIVINALKGYYSEIDFTASGKYNTKKHFANISASVGETHFSSLFDAITIPSLDSLDKYEINGIASTEILYLANDSLKKLICNINTSPTSVNLEGRKITCRTKGTLSASNITDVKSFSFKTNDLQISYGKSSASGSFSINNFQKLQIETSIKYEIESQDLNTLANSKDFKSGIFTGSVNFSNSFQNFKEINKQFIESMWLEANCSIKNFSFSNKDFSIERVTGDVSFIKDETTLSKVSSSYKGIATMVSGKVFNLFHYILDNKQTVSGNLSIFSQHLDLNKLSAEANSNANSHEKWKLPSNVHLNMYVKSALITHDKLKLEAFTGNVVFRDPAIHLTSFDAKCLEGGINGNVRLVQYNNSNCVIKGRVVSKDLNVTQLFEVFDNFDQDFVKSTNLKGNLSADVTFFTEWSNDFKLYQNTLFTECEARLQNGYLIDFEPMQRLSKKEEIEELKNVRFSEISNTIILKDETVIIPRMDINSNAFNIDLAGTQSFNGDFEYQFQVILNEILSAKREKAKKRNDFGEVEEDGLGRTKIFLVMKGNPDEYSIEYDLKRGKEELKKKVDAEKKDLSRILNSLFDRKNDSVEQNNDKENNEENEPDNSAGKKNWMPRGEKEDNSIDNDMTPVWDDL